MTIAARIAGIFRYPVKGLSAEPLERITLRAGEGLPGDRRFALAHGASRFDVENPGWQQRREFLVLAHVPRLAALRTGYDEATGILTIRRGGQEVFRESIEAPAVPRRTGSSPRSLIPTIAGRPGSSRRRASCSRTWRRSMFRS